MNPQENPLEQQQNQEAQSTEFGGLNPDQLATALSFATMQGEQFMPPPDSMNPEMRQDTLMEESDEAPEEDLEGFKKEMKDTIKEEIGSIKDMIKEALNEEDGKKE